MIKRLFNMIDPVDGEKIGEMEIKYNESKTFYTYHLDGKTYKETYNDGTDEDFINYGKTFALSSEGSFEDEDGDPYFFKLEEL